MQRAPVPGIRVVALQRDEPRGRVGRGPFEHLALTVDADRVVGPPVRVGLVEQPVDDDEQPALPRQADRVRTPGEQGGGELVPQHVREGGGRRVGPVLGIPPGEQVEAPLGLLVRQGDVGVGADQALAHPELLIGLDRGHVVGGERAACGGTLDQVDDARRPPAVVPVGAEEVRMVGADHGVVRGDDVALVGVVDDGQFGEGDEAPPVVRRVPAGLGHGAVAGAADRQPARRLVADVARAVGVDEVLRRHVEEARRGAELREIGRRVQREDGGGGRARVERGPAQRHRVLARRHGGLGGASGRVGTVRAAGGGCLVVEGSHVVGRPGGGVVRDRGEVVGEARHDRAVHRRAHLEADVVAARDVERLGAGLERDEGAVAPVLVAVDALEVEVGDVGGEVREPPGDLGVVPDDDARHTREPEPGDVERARVVHGAAAQPDLVPHAREGCPEVRVVAEERQSALGESARDHPRVRSDAFADIAEQGGGGLDDRADLGPRHADAFGARGAGRGGARRDGTGGGRGIHSGHRGRIGGDRRHDHGVIGVRVGGVEVGDLRGREVGREKGPVGLLLDVAAEIPRHRLEPGDRIGRRPGLDLVVAVLQSQHGVLERDGGAVMVGEVRVHPVGVGLVVAAGGVVEGGDLLLGDVAPAERPQELVGRQLRGAEELGEPAARHVTAEVHLPEPVLGLHVPLRVEEVVGRVGLDRRDAEVVAVHRDVRLEAGRGDGAVQLGERALDRPDDETGRDQGDDGEPRDHRVGDDADAAADPAPPRGRVLGVCGVRDRAVRAGEGGEIRHRRRSAFQAGSGRRQGFAALRVSGPDAPARSAPPRRTDRPGILCAPLAAGGHGCARRFSSRRGSPGARRAGRPAPATTARRC